MVVASHYYGWPAGGRRGVDLFFVLSGFLISSLLLEERQATGTVTLRRFYARRARRLLPALAAVVAFYLVVSAVRGIDATGSVARYALYVGNVYQAFWVDGAQPELNGLTHLWSLAQEEQFYLLWPIAFLVVARARRPLAWLVALTGMLIVYRLALIGFDSGLTSRRLYFSPDTHSNGLLLGCCLAFYRRRRLIAPSRRLVAAALAVAVACVVLLPSLVMFEFAAVVLVAAAAAEGRAPRLLAARPLVWIGGISYSLYLWHPVVLWTLDRHSRPLGLLLSLSAAYASTRWIERPFRSRARSRDGDAPAAVAPAPVS